MDATLGVFNNLHKAHVSWRTRMEDLHVPCVSLCHSTEASGSRSQRQSASSQNCGVQTPKIVSTEANGKWYIKMMMVMMMPLLDFFATSISVASFGRDHVSFWRGCIKD
eukprot:2446762-Amphidinium_carterae.2